jgi:hypothetical protein
MAALVNGPVVMSVISPGAARAAVDCVHCDWRAARRRRLLIEHPQSIAKTGSESFLEMDRRRHVSLGVSDDRPPGSRGHRHIPTIRERQRIQYDVGHLFDSSGRASHRRDSLELQIRRGRGKEDSQYVVASRIDVENDALHPSILSFREAA